MTSHGHGAFSLPASFGGPHPQRESLASADPYGSKSAMPAVIEEQWLAALDAD